MTDIGPLTAGDPVTINGSVVGYTSIAGFTLTLGVRARVTSPLLFEKVATITDPNAATFVFAISGSDTAALGDGVYVCDIKVVDAGGIPAHSDRVYLLIREPVTP